jgi:hypothetical protein
MKEQQDSNTHFLIFLLLTSSDIYKFIGLEVQQHNWLWWPTQGQYGQLLS